MPQSHRGGDDASTSSLIMFILQVFCVALFSGLFFLLLIPNAPEHRVVDGFRRSDSGKVQELKVRRSEHGRDRRSKPTKLAEVTIRSARYNLPQELLDNIIDYLHNDKQALRACTLAGRRLAPRAQKHLYRTIVVRRGGSDPYTLQFSPAVLNHIRHVVVRGNLCSEVVHSCLSGQRAIEQLDLENDPRHGSHTLSRAQLPSLPGLRTLSLRWVYFRTCQDMLESLSDYRHLSDLTLDLANFYFAFAAPEDVAPPVKLPIKVLRLRLRSMPMPPSYTSRSQAILRATGRALEHLYVMLDSFAPEPNTRVDQLISVLDSLDLTANTSLQILDIEFRWTAVHFYSRVRSSKGCRFANVLLSQIYSPQCKTLTLRIHLSCLTEHADWLAALDLRMLDYLAEPVVDTHMTRETTAQALARSAGLKTVTLKIALEPTTLNSIFSRIKAHIQMQLPRLMGRGLLLIEPWTGTTDDSL